MTYPVVDTDVLIRMITGDDPEKQQAARALFNRVEVGAIEVAAPVTVFADATYVLTSPRLYGLSRASVAAVLAALARIPAFHVDDRNELLRALSIFGSTNLDFGDAFILASIEANGAPILYSYDRGFDKVSGITRVEP